jgi:3-oxoacyl-[acyl-carrier-protein] synthase III
VNETANTAAGLARGAIITGTGSYAPERVLTNRELETMVDTTDEWIVSRTGMKERRIAAPDETTSDMAAEAARRALEDAGIAAGEIDMILVPTITPDIPWPNTACLLQDKIGASKAFCFGLEAACSGFVYGLETASNFIRSGAADTALVVGAEKMSAFLNWEDRNTCVLFGDGAGAAVLQAATGREGVVRSSLGSDGSLSDLLQVPAGGSRLPASQETVRKKLHTVQMNGREVFKHAVTNMATAVRDLLNGCEEELGDIDWFIPHQANLRIIRAVGQKLGVPEERFIVNVEKYGNTSGASIGLALDEAARDGRIREGHRVVLVAFGGGFTWGATLIRWTKPSR